MIKTGHIEFIQVCRVLLGKKTLTLTFSRFREQLNKNKQRLTWSVIMSFLVKGSSVRRSLKLFVLKFSCSTAWTERRAQHNIVVLMAVWQYKVMWIWALSWACEVTYLMRKHIACDLVGNNMRVICEDIVQNRAVILSYSKTKRRVECHSTSSTQQH